MDRRAVLKGAAMISAASQFSPFAAAQAFGAEKADWVWRPMRWVQVNFTDDDPGRFDPQFWLDFIKRTHSDGVCFSAGGILAFYPTKVPFHERSKFLGNLDPFGDMARACKEMGLRVLGRVDPSIIRADAIAAHPDWVARASDGKPRKHPDDPALFLSCPNGPMSFEWVPQVMKEIVGTYGVDGIFGNRWSGGLVGVCYCDVCKAQFRAYSGADLPANAFNRQDPAVIAYQRWNDEKRFDQLKTYNGAIHSLNPDGLFAPGSSWQRLDPKRLRENFRTIYADQQQRPQGNPIWTAGRGAKEAACIMQGGPVAGSVNVAQAEFKDSVQSIGETLAFMHDGMAQGFRPWLIKFKAELFDKRWVEPVARTFAWHAKNERYFRNTENLATVAMMQSLQTNSTYQSGAPINLQPVSAMTAGGNEGALNGAYQALTEARIPFALVDDRDLDPAILSKFRAIVLPNIAAMSDSQCVALRDYVNRGGAIVATGETSLYDEAGAERKNFGLAELFGCDYAGQIDKKVENSYISIEGRHPLTAGIDNTSRIIGGTRIVHTRPREGSGAPPLRLIRSYPDQPAEQAYPREPASDLALAYARTYGKGRVIYFPFNLDQVFWEQSSADHLALLRNAALWAAETAQPLSVEGLGFVDVSYWKQERSFAAHLVNLNNASSMKGYIHDMAPVGPFTVDLQVPPNARITRVKLLEAERDVPCKRIGDRLRVDVPLVHLHEVIALDLV